MQLMVRASLVAIRAGRESGLICAAASLEREGCYCVFPPNHIGNVHGCAGDFTHPAHVWYFEGREVPATAPVDTEVQCPNCNIAFNTKHNRNIDTSKVALDGNIVGKEVKADGG